MQNIPESNMPSVSIQEWRLYEPRVRLDTHEVIGIRTPDSTYYPFEDGESVEFISDGKGSRDVYIRLKDDSRITFSSWGKLREEKIKEIFNKMDPIYAKLFQYVLSDFPELNQVHIELGTNEDHEVLSHTGGFFRKPDKKNPNPLIVVGDGGDLRHRELLDIRRISVEFAAKSLDVDVSFLRRNPWVLGAFIFCHEIGHAHDFINTYLTKYGDPHKAAEEAKSIRKMFMSQLPVPSRDPVFVHKMFNDGRLDTFYEKYKEWYKTGFNIFSAEQLLKEHESSYKRIPDEVYADEFSSKVLLKYWDKLGFNNLT